MGLFMRHILNGCCLFLLSLMLLACERNKKEISLLSSAERLIANQPDSALLVLQGIKTPERLSRAEQAHFYLLHTEAEDKCRIPHTTDSLISIAVNFYENTDDALRKAKAWYYKGRINQDLDRPLLAQDYYLKALRERGKIHDHALLGRINNHIGLLYTYQDVYEKALPFQKEAVYHFSALNDSMGVAFASRDLARVYHMMDELDSARFYYEEAQRYTKGEKTAVTGSELGSLYLDMGLYKEAHDQIRLALNEDKDENYPIYLTLGDYFIRVYNPDSAIYYLNKAAESPSRYTRRDSYRLLYKLKRIQGDLRSALAYNDRCELLLDSIQEFVQTVSIRQAQAMYDYQEQENKLLNATLTSTHLKLVNAWLTIALIGVSLVCTFLFFHHRIRQTKTNVQHWKIKGLSLLISKEKLEEQLSKNEKDIRDLEEMKIQKAGGTKELITLRTEQLEQENKNIARSRERQEQLESRFQNSEICIRFRRKEEWKPSAKDWAELCQNLDLAYNNFTIRLKKLNDLTDKELKIACLIKANVSPGIISHLLCCSTASVSMTRKRLYQKIHNESGSAEQFDDFIRQF